MTLVSTSSYAITGNYTSVDWKSAPSIVYMECTGTIIAGKYVLTAAHCADPGEGAAIATQYAHDPDYYTPTKQISPLTKVISPTQRLFDEGLAPGIFYDNWHNRQVPKMYTMDSRYTKFAIPSDFIFVEDPNSYASNMRHDIAVFTLKDSYQALEKVIFLNPTKLTLGQHITVMGARNLGDKHPLIDDGLRAGPAIMANVYDDDEVANGIKSPTGFDFYLPAPGFWVIPEPGDSGGIWLNEHGDGVGINRASSGNADGSVFYDNADFILENINAWQFPTYAKIEAGDKKTITIQNLHNKTIDINNTLNTSGDAYVDSNTCQNVAPYGECKLVVSSVNGESGQVVLEKDFVININKLPEKYTPPTPTPTPTPTPDDGGGTKGGSMGLFALFFLMFVGIIRRKKNLQ